MLLPNILVSAATVPAALQALQCLGPSPALARRLEHVASQDTS